MDFVPRLSCAHPDHPFAEVNVTPCEAQDLLDSHAGERRYRQEGPIPLGRSREELPHLGRRQRAGLALSPAAGDGEWSIAREKATLEGADGTIAYRFHARDAHVVLSSRARDPIPYRVLLDGEGPGPSHGSDVDENGNGILLDGRLYQLVRTQGTVRERTLEITFVKPGAEAYAFTFG